MALVKSADVWLLYEDDAVEPVAESTVQQTFGAASDFLVRHGTDSVPKSNRTQVEEEDAPVESMESMTQQTSGAASDLLVVKLIESLIPLVR